MPTHRALVVEATLMSPVLDAGDPLHLDGIVIQAHARRWGMEPLDRQTDLSTLPLLDSLPLPLSVVTMGGLACAVCSAAEPVGQAAPALVHQAKRRDPEDWDRLARPVNVAAGPSKNRMEQNFGRIVAGLRWYAWGHRAGLLDLLRLLWGPTAHAYGYVGSKRRSGSGQIASWSVEDGSHAPEGCWLTADGRARRHLPASWVVSADRWRRGAYASPYWHPERQVEVPWIGVGVELRPEVRAALTDLGCR